LPETLPERRRGVKGDVRCSQIAQNNGSIYADLVLSIPSPEFEKALDELRGSRGLCGGGGVIRGWSPAIDA
jgi:hypothetical protein